MASLLTLKILDGYTRPVVSLGENITCLVDTGADTPVWTEGVEALESCFQTKKIEGKKFVLSGFGKEPEIVDVYRVSDIILKENDESKIVFKNMVVACTERPNMVASLIMPATALSHMNYLIHNVGIENPVIEVEHDKEEYAVSAVYSNVDNSFVERVYSFAND